MSGFDRVPFQPDVGNNLTRNMPFDVFQPLGQPLDDTRRVSAGEAKADFVPLSDERE